MGLNPSSIYAAFGDKHALFSLVVKRYLETRAQYAAEALQEPSLEKVIRALFDKTVAFLTTRPSSNLYDTGGGHGLQR
jgi:AcrR family transcriptional regulator